MKVGGIDAYLSQQSLRQAIRDYMCYEGEDGLIHLRDKPTKLIVSPRDRFVAIELTKSQYLNDKFTWNPIYDYHLEVIVDPTMDDWVWGWKIE